MKHIAGQWKRVLATVLIIAVAAPAGIAWSQQTYEYNLDGDFPTPTGFEKGLTKLGRGLSNILLGWTEIPLTWDKKMREGKPLQYLIGVAPVLGTARAVMRTGSGVFEVVTFPLSDRAINYEATIEPEYLF